MTDKFNKNSNIGLLGCNFLNHNMTTTYGSRVPTSSEFKSRNELSQNLDWLLPPPLHNSSSYHNKMTLGSPNQNSSIRKTNFGGIFDKN